MKGADFDDIKNTINYVDLYEIVKQRMSIPTGLLEKVCESIIRRIKHQYPFVKRGQSVFAEITAAAFELRGKVGVTMTKKI